jgi:hypothetical protein
MNRRRDRNVNALSKALLLPSESSEDFESLYAALEEEIKPRGIIERLYLERFRAHRLGDLALATLQVGDHQSCLPTRSARSDLASFAPA